MRIRVKKWGNSLALRIPKPFADDAHVKEGTLVNLSVSEGRLVVVPLRRRPVSLHSLLARVNDSNLHSEVDFGSPVGRESW